MEEKEVEITESHKMMSHSKDESQKEDEISRKKESFWHVDREMLPYKMHFFFFIGGMAATLPYLSAFGITELGLTASNLAAVSTVQQFTFLLAKPLIGYLTDYFNKLKLTIVALTILQAVITLIFFMIPISIVPANNEHLLNSLQITDYNCDTLKENYQTLMMVSGNHVDDYIMEHIMSCYKKPDGELTMLQCSKDCTHWDNTSNSIYRISKRKCSNFHDEKLQVVSSLNSTSFELISILHANESRNFHTVCLFPDGIKLNLESHCYGVTNSSSRKIEKILRIEESLFMELHCSKPTDNPEYVNIAGLSSANFKTYQFWMYFVCAILISIFISSLFTMSDTACYESIQGVNYGRQRAWGAISWGLIAPLAGLMIDYTGIYFYSWGLMVLLCSIQIWNLRTMNLVKPDFSKNVLKDVKSLFKSMEFLAFVAGVFMNGMFLGIVWFYLTWFLISIGGNKLIIGLAHTVQCYFGEAPVMFISDWLVKKLGHFNVVTLAIICHGVRFFLYSHLHDPWWILPIEILHGFTFGSFLTAITSYAKIKAKPGVEATMQSVLACTYEGLGVGIGVLVVGVCFDIYGSHTTFFYAAVLCGICSMINIIFTIAVKFQKSEQIEPQTADSADREEA